MRKEMFVLIVLTALILPLASALEQNVTPEVVPNETQIIVINEFVVDPQTDWNNSTQINSVDEWVELYNADSEDVNLTGWNLSFLSSVGSLQQTLQLSGIISSQEYLVLLNPPGTQGNDGRFILRDSYGREIDAVSYGDYDDGNAGDNAPDGNSNSPLNECVSRIPNAKDTDVDSDDFAKTQCTYASENNMTFIPIVILDLLPTPNCAISSNNVTLSANITGSIQRVFISLNTDGSWKDILLPGNNEGVYKYIVPSSALTGNSTIEWKFNAEDLAGSIEEGKERFLYIHSSTTLSILPSSPDGLNNWYISEPQFTLSNHDALPNKIFYQWDGQGPFVYTSPFGLENIPNAPPIESAGILELKWWSETECGEEALQYLNLKADLTDPQIEDISPQDNETVYTRRPTVSALLDEVYQSNSGVNEEVVTLSIDGVPVNVSFSSISSMKKRITFTPQNDFSQGMHNALLYAEDNAGRSSEKLWNFEILDIPNFTLSLYSPLSGIYLERRLPFNLSLSREAGRIEFINYNDRNPRFEKLCEDCSSYGFDIKRFETLNEGENVLVFRAHDPLDGYIEAATTLVIDSEAPSIVKTKPLSGFTSGEFYIEFEEDNPVELVIHYGNDISGWKYTPINLDINCELDKKSLCNIALDLSEYDGENIEYFVTLSDIAGNMDESRKRALDVDFSSPIINELSYDIEGKYVTFLLNVTEPYLNEIVYLDTSDAKPTEKTLCTKLTLGVCEKKISFKDGDHNITIIARDEAGNEAEAFIFFFTDSEEPRITKTMPKSGFATGLFELTFEEENPTQAFLYYGTSLNMKSVEIDLSTCENDGSYTFCSVSRNLSEYDGKEIVYWFSVKDKVGNEDESAERTLLVDVSPPAIEFFNYTTSGNKVTFTVEVDEENFDSVGYIDYEEAKPNYRTICTSLKNGVCEKTKTFKKGQHDISLSAVDDAGNTVSIIEGLEFHVI